MSFLDQINSDLNLFLADFGESQIWTPAGGLATPFVGVPEEVDKDLLLAMGSVSSYEWSVWGKTSIIGGAKKGDALTFNHALAGLSGRACTVVENRVSPADLGPGLTRLMLKKS